MAYTFDDHWLTEALRLRESLWGPLEDSAEAGRARAQGGDFQDRVLTRTRLLARREQLDSTLTRWRQLGRLGLILFALGALLAGVAAAGSTLGSGARPVNLALALAGLLGFNTFTFLLWAFSFALGGGSSGSLLADLWLNLTRRLARSADAALLPRALLELLARQRLQRWSAGVLSHGLWALALLSALACLLVLLATRRYIFQWETTLLSPDVFVAMVQGLGWLPSYLGFPVPTAELIRASGGTQDLPESAHAAWSAWLLGIVIVYGLLPRLAALALSLLVVRRRLSRLTIDPSLAGIAELHDKLLPASMNTGIDAPAAPADAWSELPQPAAGEPGKRLLLGLELPPDLPWPPPALLPQLNDLGIIDTREQRRQVLETLRHHPAERLLVCCDARQTPDRGALAILTELRSLSGDMQVALLPQNGEPARRSQWRQQLLHAGFTPEQLQNDFAAGLGWLAAGLPASADPHRSAQ